jgi:ribonuclease BN (tRNA processing enzyme)
MRITTLGCNASITGARRTTCYRVDDDILIDCGTGAADLTLEQAIAIDNVFLTHSHLDHCGLLSMLADAAGSFRSKPVAVHALPETLAALKQHMFNGVLWPDYTVLPTPEHPFLRFHPIGMGETSELAGRRITALPARHSVPCAAWCVDSGKASWVYSADTTLCEDFWHALNRTANLEYLLVECTFRNDNAAGAARSGHHTAQMLAQGLAMLKQPVELYIVHMEAGYEDITLREVMEAAMEYRPQVLQRGQVFEL